MGIGDYVVLFIALYLLYRIVKYLLRLLWEALCWLWDIPDELRALRLQRKTRRTLAGIVADTKLQHRAISELSADEWAILAQHIRASTEEAVNEIITRR
jgi:hypothetical protein